MTTIVDALNRIARQCGVKAPSSWVTATRDDHVAIRNDFLLETVDDICDRLDLAGPIGKQATLTGGGGTTQSDGSERFDLPADFRRLQRDELAIYDPQLDQPCVPITNDGAWQHLTDIGASGSIKHYRTAGYDGNWTIDLYMAPATGDIYTVNYISTYWKATANGTAGDTFSAETDVLLLPRRVVEAGTVWRWRERQGLPYRDKMMEYEALISRLSNDSRNRRVINMGPREAIRWQDAIPAFIPPT